MSKRRPRPNSKEHEMARALDELAAYDQFKSEIAPVLREALANGWDAQRMKADPKIKSLLTARLLSIALGESNPSAALAAIREFSDRTEGKVAENKNLKVNLESAPEEVLDEKLAALLEGGIMSEEDTLN